MGGRKFKFSARKNEERKRAAKAKLIKPTQDLDAQPDMTVSLPLTAFTAGVLLAKGGTHENPNVQEFLRNTQALRVVNSFCKRPSKGNCRGNLSEANPITDKENEPLPKRTPCARRN